MAVMLMSAVQQPNPQVVQLSQTCRSGSSNNNLNNKQSKNQRPL
jgi:hypothetical protein